MAYGRVAAGRSQHLPSRAGAAVVIGKTATKVQQADAMSYVFGYRNFLDMSARGINPNGRLSFYLGKSWDTFAAMELRW